MLQLHQWVLQEEPSQDSQKQPEMTKLEHMWQMMKKEPAGNMLAMGFLLMSAKTMNNILLLRADTGFLCYHHIESKEKHLLNTESYDDALSFIYWIPVS